MHTLTSNIPRFQPRFFPHAREKLFHFLHFSLLHPHSFSTISSSPLLLDLRSFLAAAEKWGENRYKGKEGGGGVWGASCEIARWEEGEEEEKVGERKICGKEKGGGGGGRGQTLPSLPCSLSGASGESVCSPFPTTLLQPLSVPPLRRVIPRRPPSPLPPSHPVALSFPEGGDECLNKSDTKERRTDGRWTEKAFLGR